MEFLVGDSHSLKILNFLPDVICIANGVSGEISFVNAAFDKLIVVKDFAYRMNFLGDFFKATQNDVIISSLKQIFESEDQVPVNIGMLDTLTKREKDSLPTYASVEWFGMKLDDQKILFSGHKRETGKGVEENANEAELYDFFQNAPIALHWLGGTGNILWANQKELDTLGYTAEEYIGHNVMEFCPDEKERVLETFKILGNGNPIANVPFKFRAKNGDPKYLLIDSNVSLHPDGTFNHTRCFIRDDTERIISSAINELKEAQSEELHRNKDIFMRQIFHELQTPVRGISTILSNQMQPQDMDNLREMVTGLETMMSDFIFASQFHSGNALVQKPESFEVRSTIEEIFNEVYLSRRRSGQALKLNIDMNDMPSHIIIDRSLMDRAFSNIFINAIHSTLDIGDINVMIRYEPNSPETSGSEGFFLISVEYITTHEIDLAMINRRFQHMYQPFNESKENEFRLQESAISTSQGNGISLYVAYSAVQSLGSTLECQIDNNIMSFIFSLTAPTENIKRASSTKRVRFNGQDLYEPFGKEVSYREVVFDEVSTASTASTDDSAEDEPIIPRLVQKLVGNRKQILLVDDSPICQKLLSQILVKAGYAVQVASNGHEALEMLSIKPVVFDAVLMDLRMPVMDGVTATVHARLDLKLKIPIIALSASEEYRRRALESGADEFISKPAKASHVIHTLQLFGVWADPNKQNLINKGFNTSNSKCSAVNIDGKGNSRTGSIYRQLMSIFAAKDRVHVINE